MKVFIDGSSGTTGLRLKDRLSARSDVTLLTIAEDKHRDPAERQRLYDDADVVFFCLPDDAAREAAALVDPARTVVIDTSTAHRTDPDWVYGMPELAGQREKIRTARRIANPGCHASGFIVLVAPLIRAGLLSPDTALTCFSLTGYSGGGKKMIAQYEAAERSALLGAPRQYGLTQAHKHLPEMQKVCGLSKAPVFCPVVEPFYAGMEVTVPVFAEDLAGTADDVRDVYAKAYPGGLIRFRETADEGGFLSAAAYTGRDDMEVTVCGNGERLLLVSRFDNLGKGASGAAIQNMNILMGAAETAGLVTDGGSL